MTCGGLRPPSTEELNPAHVERSLLPLLLESSTESVAELSSTSLERILGPAESDAFLARIYQRLVTGCYNIIAHHSDPNRYATTPSATTLTPTGMASVCCPHWNYSPFNHFLVTISLYLFYLSSYGL